MIFQFVFFVLFVMNLIAFLRLYTPVVYGSVVSLISCTNTAWSFLEAMTLKGDTKGHAPRRVSWAGLFLVFFLIKVRAVLLEAKTRWSQYWLSTLTPLSNNRFRLTHLINGALVHIVITPNRQFKNVVSIQDHNGAPILRRVAPFISFTQDVLHPEDVQVQAPISVVYVNPDDDPVGLLHELVA
jgi:hypothetical protein